MNSSSPQGWAFRSFPVFCHDEQSRGARPSPQAISHVWEESCRVSFQEWRSWIKGRVTFIFWLLLRAWSLWRVRWSRVQQQGMWGRACPGPLQGTMSIIGACIKPNKATRESLTLKPASPTLDFCKDTFLDGEIALSHFWALSGWLNQGQALGCLFPCLPPNLGSETRCSEPVTNLFRLARFHPAGEKRILSEFSLWWL